MKPYGREKKFKGGKPWKVDVHPKKGYVNWWENMCDFFTRSRMKQNWKSEIEREISDNENFEFSKQKDHLCWAHSDINHKCFICGKQSK